MSEEMRTYIESQRAAGYSDEAIREALIDAGWDNDLIFNALERAKKIQITGHNPCSHPSRVKYSAFALGSALLYSTIKLLEIGFVGFNLVSFALIFFGFTAPYSAAFYQAQKGYQRKIRRGLSWKMILFATLSMVPFLGFVLLISAGSAENYVLYIGRFLMRVMKSFTILIILSVISEQIIYNSYDKPNHWFRTLPFLIKAGGAIMIFCAVFWIGVLHFDINNCGSLQIVQVYKNYPGNTEASGYSAQCWARKAQEKNNPLLCSRARDSDTCIFELARQTKQYDLCTQIREDARKFGCQLDVDRKRFENERYQEFQKKESESIKNQNR